MKKFLALTLALLLTLSLAACGEKAPAAPAEPAAEPVTLHVFAAASLTETLNSLVDAYKAIAPDVTVVATLDSSGTLKTQIQEGADCDLFLSASGKPMNALDITADAEKNPDKLDFVASDSRIKLLENKVVLAVPAGNPAAVKGFEDLANCDLIALGNSDVPVGSYSLEILETLGISVAELEKAGKITYGSNVKEVTTQISEGAVSCGIIYATDAAAVGLTVVAEATPELCSQVIYPAAVMKNSAHPEAAQAFLDYLQTPEAVAVFEAAGFRMAK